MLASFDRRTTGALPEDNLTPSPDGSVLFAQTQADGVHDPTAAAHYGAVFAFPKGIRPRLCRDPRRGKRPSRLTAG
jgi:hypothetical protein